MKISVTPVHMACALACLQPLSASMAQDANTQELAPVLVTANRVEQPLTDVLSDFTLIDEQQIQHSGAANMADLLVRQAGLELSRNGGPGTTTSLFMRGADSNKTAVYINGVRVDVQSGSGGAPWEAIALSDVERIEIVRGPAAAIYGSDAMAGVVQIFTKKGSDAFTPYVQAGVGSYGRATGAAGFSGQSGGFDYALGFSRDVSKGFDVYAVSDPKKHNPDKDGYQQNTAHMRLGAQINPQQRVELFGTYTNIDARYDGVGKAVDEHGYNRLSTLGAAWQAQWTPHYSTRVSVSESHQRYATAAPVTPTYLARTNLRNYLWMNEWRQGAHLFTGALERREDRFSGSGIAYAAKSRHQNALALGYGYSAGPHTVQLNARYDRDSEFGGQATGSVAYGFDFGAGWRATAAYGTSFRVPTLYQRFSEYGDTSLQPEKGRNAEVGLHWRNGDSHAGITVYHNRIRNMINWESGVGTCPSMLSGGMWGGCYANTGKALLKGATLSAGHRFGQVNVGATLDLQNPRNTDTDKLLARRSKRIFKLHADAPLTTGALHWRIGGELQAHSQRFDNAGNTKVLPGYTLVNLYASTTIGRDWTLLARVDNVANKKYQLANTDNTAGRAFYLGLRWSPR